MYVTSRQLTLSSKFDTSGKTIAVWTTKTVITVYKEPFSWVDERDSLNAAFPRSSDNCILSGDLNN